MINDKNFDPNNIEEKLKKLKNAADQQLLNMNAAQNFKVNIRPDKSVSKGKFLPDPLMPNGYKAHPTTILALRKDIFAVGEEIFDDLEELYICQCKREIDLQFWSFCPYCEAQIKK